MARHKFTSEEAKKANKASRESARKNHDWREYVKTLGKLSFDVPLPGGGKMKTTWDGAVIVAAYRAAILKGDSQARQFLGKLNGQLDDTQNVNVTANVKHQEDLTPAEAAEFIAELKKRI